MPGQRVPRQGAQKRSRRFPPPDEAGGSGSVSIGPDFGEGAGSDDETFRASVAVVFDTMAAEHDAFTASANVEFSDVTAEHDAWTSSADLVELVYDGEDVAGSNSAVNDGPDNWSNPTNAQGLRDGTEASRAGSATAAINANLHLSYANYTGGFETFTISLVELRFDTRQTGTTLGNGGLHHEYRLDGGSWVSLAVFTDNVDNNPTTYDITAAVGGDWAKLNALEVRVRCVLALGATLVNCFCDAVEARVVAAKTVSL